jgi:hypothetical protein
LRWAASIGWYAIKTAGLRWSGIDPTHPPVINGIAMNKVDELQHDKDI